MVVEIPLNESVKKRIDDCAKAVAINGESFERVIVAIFDLADDTRFLTDQVELKPQLIY